MKRPALDFSTRWGTAWAGPDIVVLRNGVEVDRIHAIDIRRVIFVLSHDAQGRRETSFALVELGDEFVLFPGETGFAGRVHFERQVFWAARACIYWATTSAACLPPQSLARSGFMLMGRSLRYGRLPRAALSSLLERWSIEGPASWEERRSAHANPGDVAPRRLGTTGEAALPSSHALPH